MEDVPTGQDLAAGSESVFIGMLDAPELTKLLQPCPDWPDLN